MPTQSLIKRDWQKQHVYLITYPRCRLIPSLSPYSLKLETWLRVNEIPYTAISNDFKRYSSRGQVPFVELNGRALSDSNIIIETLKHDFKKDPDTSVPSKKARERAILALVEDEFTPAFTAYRQQDLSFPFSDDGWGRLLGQGLKKRLFKWWHERKIKAYYKKYTLAQGMGVHAPEELETVLKEDINAIATLLGDKPYFGGDTPATIDCVVFGHLAAIIYTPTPNGIVTKYLKENKPNLAEFAARMKEKFWPDWEDTCRTMDMNTHHKTN